MGVRENIWTYNTQIKNIQGISNYNKCYGGNKADLVQRGVSGLAVL